MTSHSIKKGNIKLTLSVNEDILDRYKDYCEKEGIILSKQVEKFMEAELKKTKKYTRSIKFQ